MYNLDLPVVAHPDKPSDREKNILLNNSEYNQGKITLASTPEGIGIGTHYRCNAKCVFCLEEKTNFFTLERYKKLFEPRLGRVISNARFVNFCGFGELLLMPEIEDFMDYVNKKIPEVNKIYTTNGYSLMNKKILERLTETKSAIGISLHASDSSLHRLLTNTDTFGQIVSGVKQLVSVRKQKECPSISLIFLINTLNIEDLPDFIEFAANLGVDEVSCGYMTIFNPGHLELSCYFKQELTNENLRKAEECAQKLSLAIRFPPKFKQAPSDRAFKCSDPWKYCYVENEGSVLACCYAGSNFGYLEYMDFEMIWNGADYKQLRRSLLNDSPHEWCRYCYKWRQDNVNDIRSHINSRPGFRDEILKEISLTDYYSQV